MKPTLILAAIAAASSFTPALAQDAGTPAQDAGAERRQIVSYGDLDLSREADQRKLDRRLAIAIAEVCGTASNADLEGKNEARRCRVELSGALTAERERAIASNARQSILVAARER